MAQEMIGSSFSVGTVEAIYITASAGEKMQPLYEAEAVSGQGLTGDRYFKGTGYYSKRPLPDGGRQITLIEHEELERLEEDTGIHLDPSETRRNVLTRAIHVNHLIGKQFYIGEILCEGIRICEPCTYLEKLTGKRVMRPLVHTGGLRARIISGGIIRVGDEILEVTGKPVDVEESMVAGASTPGPEIAGKIDPDEMQAEGVVKKTGPASIGTHYLETESGSSEYVLVSKDLELDDFLGVRVRAFGYLSKREGGQSIIDAFLVSAI